MTDEILAEHTRQGRSTAFAALVARHCQTVYRIGRNVCASAADAEEVTRQTFLSAYHGAHSRPSGSSVRIWLCGIAMKKASAQRQRGWRSQTVSLEAFLPRFDVEGGLEPPGAEWPELGSALAEQVNVAGFLRKALDDMDEGIRAAFVGGGLHANRGPTINGGHVVAMAKKLDALERFLPSVGGQRLSKRSVASDQQAEAGPVG